MSAYTTINITRSKAKDALVRSILGELDDSLLEKYCDRLLDHKLYNTRIVNDGEENDNGVLDNL